MRGVSVEIVREQAVILYKYIIALSRILKTFASVLHVNSHRRHSRSCS